MFATISTSVPGVHSDNVWADDGLEVHRKNVLRVTFRLLRTCGHVLGSEPGTHGEAGSVYGAYNRRSSLTHSPCESIVRKAMGPTIAGLVT